MGIDLQPTLEDTLVLLRPLHSDDYEALYRVAKDPFIWEQHPANDRYKPEVFAAFFHDAIHSHGALLVIDKATDVVIGSSRYRRVEHDASAVEIGWTFLAREYWGGTYNRAMKSLMINHAFQFFDHVVLHIGASNMRSRKAAEKIGGILISATEYPTLVSTTPDTVTYRIDKFDWQQKGQ